jgi:hypothetical protein
MSIDPAVIECVDCRSVPQSGVALNPASEDPT